MVGKHLFKFECGCEVNIEFECEMVHEWGTICETHGGTHLVPGAAYVAHLPESLAWAWSKNHFHNGELLTKNEN
jgi:hypothetical protein